MKVLFLDLSGTMDNDVFLGTSARRGQRFDPANIVCLNRVTDTTGAQIVISSDWVKREPEISYPGVCGWLANEGVTGTFIGHTHQPMIESTMRRPHHIKAWLDDHPEVESYAIVDDYRLPVGEHRQWWRANRLVRRDLPPEVPGMAERFVHVDGMYGLTDEGADLLIAILGERDE